MDVHDLSRFKPALKQAVAEQMDAINPETGKMTSYHEAPDKFIDLVMLPYDPDSEVTAVVIITIVTTTGRTAWPTWPTACRPSPTAWLCVCATSTADKARTTCPSPSLGSRWAAGAPADPTLHCPRCSHENRGQFL